MTPRRLWCVLLAIGATVTLGFQATAVRVSDAAGRTQALPQSRPPMQARTLVVAGLERRYLLHVPAAGADKPRPLVIVMHGNGGSAAQVMGEDGSRAPLRVWLDVADRDGWFVAAPDGTLSEGANPRRGWNDCRGDTLSNPQADDVAFLEQLVSDVERTARVDRQRVFAMGHSNGGNMALRLAIELPSLVAAVAAVAAAMPAQSECAAPSKFLPVLFVSGTADPILPYAGGAVGLGVKDRGTVLSAQESVAIWVALGGLRTSPNRLLLPNRDRRDGTRVTRLTYTRADGAPGVVLYRVDGGDHGIPSRIPRDRATRLLSRIGGSEGRPNGDIESAEAVAAFFRDAAR